MVQPRTNGRKIFANLSHRLKKRGRRTILTEALIEEFVDLLPRVMFLETVADLLCVDRMTWRNWIKLGKKEIRRLESNPNAEPDPNRELHVKFFYAYRLGMAEGEKNAIMVVSKASKRYWSAGAWILERTRPTRYGANAKELRDLQKEVKELARHMGK